MRIKIKSETADLFDRLLAVWQPLDKVPIEHRENYVNKLNYLMQKLLSEELANYDKNKP